jgi:hypothetical protein
MIKKDFILDMFEDDPELELESSSSYPDRVDRKCLQWVTHDGRLSMAAATDGSDPKYRSSSWDR